MIAALITEAQTNPAFAASTARGSSSRAATRHARSSAARSSAVRSPPDTKVEVALDLLYGPVYHRLLHGHAPLSDRFIRDVIDTTLDGIAPAGTRE